MSAPDPMIPADVLADAPIDPDDVDALVSYVVDETAIGARVEDALGQLDASGEDVPPSVVPIQRARSWEPDDDTAAEWAMAKVAAAERERRAAVEQAEEWHARIDEWLRDTTRRPAATAAFFTGKLEGYLRRRFDADPSLRTVRLPSGTLRVTVPKAGKVVVEDPAAVIDWVERTVTEERAAEIVKRPEPTVLVSGLRRIVGAVKVGDAWVAIDQDTGETPPGVTAIPPSDPTYSVNPA